MITIIRLTLISKKKKKICIDSHLPFVLLFTFLNFYRILIMFLYTLLTDSEKGKRKKMVLYAHAHRSILGAAGHIILIPANQLMVMGLKICHCPIRVLNQGPFDHLPNALTNCTNRAH
jgi:hypothetical protein